MAEIEEHISGHLLDYTLLEQLDHGLTVSHFAMQLARTLGCDDAFTETLGLAGLVHDIGKIRLGRYVEDGKSMTIDEIKYVRMHSMFGSELLKQQGFSEEIQQMVLYHHENYDGSGYPRNLRGEAIPKGARILRVCDVYAALLSDRPYRRAFDRDTAMSLMIEEVKNFDMQMFLAFQRLVHEEDLRPVVWLQKLPVQEQTALLRKLFPGMLRPACEK